MKKNFQFRFNRNQFSIFLTLLKLRGASNFKFISVGFILILAAFLRLYRIGDYMTFLGDEGRDVLVVYNILHGKLTLLGPTSSVGGFFLGPIYYYFMAPFLWLFNYNPVGPAVMVALFGVATVWLIYKFCSDLFNKRVGLIAALLYAISPLVIAYSRSSWNPNPLPFFSLLSLFTLYKGIVKKSYKLIFASGILLGISMQLHYLAMFLAFIIFLYILFTEIFVERFNLKKLLLSLIKKYSLVLSGFVIGWLPFLAFELRHGFLNIKKIFDFVFSGGNAGENTNFFVNLYDVFFRLFARLITSFPPIEQLELYNKQTLLIWTGLALMLAVLSTVVLLQNLIKSYKNKSVDFQKYLLLSLWFFVGILLFGFYKKSIYDYYFSFMFPVPFIMLGLLMSFIYENKKIKYLGKVIAIPLFALLFFCKHPRPPF